MTVSKYSKRLTLYLNFITIILALISIAPTVGHCSKPSSFSITLSHGVDLDITKYSSNGTDLLLFIYPTSGRGIDHHHESMAQELSGANIEVWLADITDALFLPNSSSTMRKFTGEYLAELIEKAHLKTGKNIIIAGHSYAAIPVLRGAYQWQKSNPKTSYLKTAVLFTPKLYKTLPPLGQDPQYLPIVSATNIPLIIFQGSKHGNKWQLPNLLETLHTSNFNIVVEMIPDIGSPFVGKTVTEKQQLFFKRLPSKLQYSFKLQNGNTPLRVAKDISFDTITDTGIDNHLKIYSGRASPLPINLLDYTGNRFKFDDYKGKVTVVNF